MCVSAEDILEVVSQPSHSAAEALKSRDRSSSQNLRKFLTPQAAEKTTKSLVEATELQDSLLSSN